MKKRNPLYWNLSVLDEDVFQSRAFSLYRKDKLFRTPTLRGKIKSSVGTYPRVGDKLKWLPNATLRIFPLEYLERYRLEQDIENKEFLTEFYEHIRELAGVTNPNDIVHLARIESYIDQGQLYTPFMMLHDLGESLFAFSHRYANDFNLNSPEKVYQHNAQSVIEEAAVNLEYPLVVDGVPRYQIIGYIPKLVHTQFMDNKPYSPPSYLNWIYKTRSFERVYIIPFTSDVNWLSDVWALWCKNGELKPQQFYTPEQLQLFLNKQLGQNIKFHTDSYYDGSVEGGLTLWEWCEYANKVFSEVLEYIKGSVVSYGMVIK